MTKSYPTRLINDTRKPVNVHELDGGIIVCLEPGQVFDIEACQPTAMYARWSEVKWTDDGPRFVTRTNWKEQDRGRWLIRLLNDGNKEVEFRMIGGEEKMVPDPDDTHAIRTAGSGLERPLVRGNIGGQKICLPRGVPVLVGLQATDPLVMFKSLTIVRRRVMLKDSEHVGFLIHDWITKDEKEARSPGELKALERVLDELGKKGKS